MSLVALVCPPLYCALHRRWGACVAIGVLWVIAAWLLGVGILRWSDPLGDWILALYGATFWLLASALVLSVGSPKLRKALVAVTILAVPVAVGMRLYQNVVLKAVLVADQGTLAAMRSAIAIYYGQHRSYPEHPGNYVNPSPPPFVCTNLTYVYSINTGELRITSTNDLYDCL